MADIGEGDISDLLLLINAISRNSLAPRALFRFRVPSRSVSSGVLVTGITDAMGNPTRKI